MQNQNAIIAISYNTMRKAIGWIGILLPFVLAIGNIVLVKLDVLNNEWFIYKSEDCATNFVTDVILKSSISHYYYSSVGELFTGALAAVSLFLFTYNRHPKRKGEIGLSDAAMTNLAAIFALGVVVFPTNYDSCITDNIRGFISSRNTGIIHLLFAALFFMSLAIMSLINFRRTAVMADFGKMPSHPIYKKCGIVMLVCIALIFIYSKFLEEKHINWLDATNPVFTLETIALIAFGISWLTKGKVDYNYVSKKIKTMLT
jgi:hypothetical protein